MLWRTFRDRALSFGGFTSTPSQPTGQRSRVTRWIRSCLAYYGIRGERFEEGFVVPEGLEIFLQIWQAYTTSKTISTKFVNQSFSVLIAVSAITHPVLSRMYARHVAKKRFGSVLAEFFLDITWSSILPLCVFVNYWHVGRTLTVERLLSTFPFGSYELAQREIRHLVILSWSQFLLATIPATSALIYLLSVLRILASAQVKESSSPSVALDSGRLKVTSSMRTRTLIIALAASQRKSAFVRWGHRLIVVSGIGISLTSIAATSMFESTGRIPDTSCGFRLYPWFVTDDACVVIALSCTQLQISGDLQELNSVFTTIDVASIGLLILSDCPCLVMPTALTRATSLTALILANSTIVDWPMDVAFTTASSPPLRLLAWNGIRLPSPPPGALVKVPTWPETLERVRIAGTDIDELAQRLTTHWHTVSSWTCIDCGLVTFPAVFVAMPKLERWVVWNSSIIEIPTLYSTTETSLWPSLRVVLWTHNTRLSSVGDDVWRAVSSGSVHTLSLASTGVQDIPVHRRT
ncbi:hypothetical protein Poli38472_001368 [Pythium oligandrum]|uniref:Uncharacterized protein n=1 Tax=Pythium oligandrum TaxID=41045 RepID=A0A8K1FRP4_PYTOL|nr:hypothetical protein Poli38472_001368 [Pythium oligandrum]|eukprot:TMW69212.1 hypothetical protein Poli38472_001368 [Pythium oligandrum]